MTPGMKRSEIAHLPEYFDRYINLTADIDINKALELYGHDYLEKERHHLEHLGNLVYAPGKWTVNDIMQHVIDTERIFAYRALRISRSDTTPLPGYDENFYAEHTTAASRTLEDLLMEFELVRASSIMLFKNMNQEMLLKEGTCNNKQMSVLALGFTMVGHVIHHVGVLKERYYPLLHS